MQTLRGVHDSAEHGGRRAPGERSLPAEGAVCVQAI